jgi:membrane dipeptidase
MNYGAGSATNWGPAPKPQWLSRPADLNKLPEALKEIGFDPPKVEKLAAGNWLRVYGEVFG